jgi:hypothetical protein
MPHTQYFLCTLDALSPYAQQGQLFQIPATPGDSMPDREIIVAYMGGLDPSTDENVSVLPDALRNQAVSVEQAQALTGHGVVAGDTTFQVVDKLVQYSKDMRFQIK